MGLQIVSNEFIVSLRKKSLEVSIEEAHKAQITFLETGKNEQFESSTVYGVQEKTLVHNAFENLYLKF